jgi:hypothetical protein
MDSSPDGAPAQPAIEAPVPAPAAAGTPAAEGSADALRSTRLFVALVVLYAAAIALLYAFGLFGFFFKTVIVPSLFAVAYLTRRFASFVRDWSVFLGLTVLFDNVRGLVYGLLLQFQLPVYMGYAIAAEASLFGAPIPNVRLQRWLFTSGQIGPFEELLVLVHASHFLLFLLVGLRVWQLRPRELLRFCWAMSLVMYGAIAGYLLVPTVPPWMASSRYHVLPEITQMPRQIYNLAVPSMSEAFDVNPIAAMPSLHAAFPAMLVLVCARHFGRASWAIALYALLAWFGIVYMGEHYIVDVLAGIALAVGAYLLCYQGGPLARWLGVRGERALRVPALHELRLPLLVTALLLVLAQGASVLASAIATRDLPTAEFIARELDGKSPMASYYRGLRAYYAGDCAQVERLMAQAGREVPDAAKRTRSGLLRGECAYRSGNFAAALGRLRGARELTPEQVLMLADAELRAGKREDGVRALARVLHSAVVAPELRAAASRIAAEHGLGSAAVP